MHHKFSAFTFFERISSLFRDKRGVAAVEFAIIAPLLIMLYLMMVEASQAIDTNKKLDRAAYTVADLITQQSSTSKQDIDSIMSLAEHLLRPYSRSKLEIAVVLYKKESGNGKMEWWTKNTVAKDPPKVDTAPPASLAEGDLYLKTIIDLPYVPIMTFSNSQNDLNLTDFNIKMNSTRILVPRVANTVCSDCQKS